VAIDGVQATTHRVHRHVGTTRLSPRIDFGCELANARPTQHDPVRAEVFDRPTVAAHAITQQSPVAHDLLGGTTEENETVREPGSPVERGLAMTSKPDRDGTRRLGHERRSVNAIEATRELDDGFCKQPAKERDLLFLPGPPGVEVLSEGIVLDVVPADPYTEAESTAGQEIDIGRLPRDERGLALRKDEDSCSETDPLGDAGQIREHHKRVMERVALGVGTHERTRSIGVDGTQHVVVGGKVVKAQVLDCSSDLPNGARISSELDLRVDDADLHSHGGSELVAHPRIVPELPDHSDNASRRRAAAES
jgi:hypothetical protein